MPLLGRLGFYSDDWSFWGAMATSGGRSIRAYMDAISGPEEWVRPVEWLLHAVCFRAFGASPAGHHAVNALLFVAAALLLHEALRESGASGADAFAAAALFAASPLASSDRFWPTTVHVNLAMTCWALGCLADARSLGAGRSRAWRAASIASLVVGCLAYEVVLPLFALNAAAVWAVRLRRAGGRARAAVRTAPFVRIVLLAALLVFKLSLTTRIGGDLGRIVRDALSWSHVPGVRGFNLWYALRLGLGDLGFGLPYTAWRLRSVPGTLIAASVVAAAGAAAFAGSRPAVEPARRAALSSRALVLAGMGVFLVSHAAFLLTEGIVLAPAGTGNRTELGASAGAAVAIAGVLGAVLGRSSRRRAALVLLVACGSFTLAAVGELWARAAERQKEILDGIRRALPTLEAGTSVVLDRACPYVGPAPVFEASWDLTGALQSLYGDATLRGGVVTSKMLVFPEGLATFTYNVPALYPYASLRLYSVPDARVVALPDAEAAHARFRDFDPDLGGACVGAREGRGVPLFSAALPGSSR